MFNNGHVKTGSIAAQFGANTRSINPQKMQHYIDYLICDLQNAKKNVPQEKQPGEGYEAFENHMMELEESPDVLLSDLFGIKSDVFPPLEKLTDEQVEQLNTAIIEMWAAFNIKAVFPENLPARLLYPALLTLFSKSMHYWPGWHMGLELCNFDPDKCPFGTEYCTCKEYFQDETTNEDSV